VSVQHVLRRAVLGLTVACVAGSCGSSDSASPSSPPRDVSLEAVEYSFVADEAITIRAGDTINFIVRNAGSLDHQLEVQSSENRVLGRTERIRPGAQDNVTVTFEEAGSYRVICDIDDHLSRGQVANFEVFDTGG
jgi:plastocyanin